MNLYDLPKFSFSKIKKGAFGLIASVIFTSIIFGFLAGAISSAFFYVQIKDYLEKLNILPQTVEREIVEKEIVREYLPQTSQEEAIIKVVKEVSPAVVSIMKGETEGGTGFIVSEDGMILTNKHVVLDEETEYTIFTNDGRKFSAKVLARDPIQDLAVLGIEQEKAVDGNGEFVLESFPIVKLGDSDKLESGQTVIAIGNALGEFRNTVSVGVISGLGRKITASGGGFVEILEDVIQTDAAINKGNSGGPLLNLRGEVVGINTAMALEAQSIGFAIPINKAKKDIEQVKTIGKIVYPFLGIRYVLISEKVKEENDLPVDYGALIIDGEPGESAIWPDSAAEKAGLKEGDIVLEFNDEKITTENTLAKIIVKYNPGDEIVLKILRGAEEISVEVTLDERSE